MPLQIHTPNPASQARVANGLLSYSSPEVAYMMSRTMALLYPDVPERMKVEQDNTTQEPQPCLRPPDHFLLVFHRADKHQVLSYSHSMPRKSRLIPFKGVLG